LGARVDEVLGQRDLLEVALEELGVLDPGGGRVGAREREHLVGHVEPDGLAGGADAAGADQHVGAGPGAEVEHGLALVEVGDRGGNAAAERRGDGGAGRGGGLVAVEGGAELVAAPDRAAAAAFLGRGGSSGGGGVALADGLADVGCAQLSHAVSSSSASGRT
jgi:hypothetical protein